MDGARWWQLLLRVVLPMSLAHMVAVDYHHRGQRMERIPVAVPDVRRRIGGTTADRVLTFPQQAEGVTNTGPMAVTVGDAADLAGSSSPCSGR